MCTDLDEVFVSGWRNILEANWKKDTSIARYNYNWKLENGIPKVNFYIEKIHNRFGYLWKHPVHEALTYISDKKENKITIDDITVNHYPDTNKSRNSYLPLLELSVKEDPIDDRNMHYLGREYMYYGKWNEAIDTLIKHLDLKNATWKDEKCASMRFIARSYLNRYNEASMWLDKAIKEAPYLRDPYVEKAILEYRYNNYDGVIKWCEKALKIKACNKSYINEIFSWDHTIYDLLSIAYYYKKEYKLSLENINKAINICTDKKELKRLEENKILIEKSQWL